MNDYDSVQSKSSEIANGLNELKSFLNANLTVDVRLLPKNTKRSKSVEKNKIKLDKFITLDEYREDFDNKDDMESNNLSIDRPKNNIITTPNNKPKRKVMLIT